MKRTGRRNRRTGRKNFRRAGNSQRFANRRNEIRVALKVSPTKKDLYLIPLADLVPVTEPLPETEEQLHKISCTVTIVTNQNVTGCTFQMGISGEFAFDESKSDSSDFVPLTTPKMLSRTRPIKCTVGIPMPSRYIKGVTSNPSNFLALQIYSVCPQQTASATAIVVTNSVFKLAIKEPAPIDLGTVQDLQPQTVHIDSNPGPPANSVPVPRSIIYSAFGAYTTNDTVFPLTYTKTGDTRAGEFDITASGTPIFAGTFTTVGPSRVQQDYDSDGYKGNISYQ